MERPTDHDRQREFNITKVIVERNKKIILPNGKNEMD